MTATRKAEVDAVAEQIGHGNAVLPLTGTEEGSSGGTGHGRRC